MTIEVKITHVESGSDLGMIRIRNERVSADGEHGDYSIQFGVERITGVGVYTVGMFAFPRLRYNVLGLLLQALNTLDPEQLKLDELLDLKTSKRKSLSWLRLS